MGLVDDEEGEAALAVEVRESSAKLGEETGKAESRLGLESEQDLMVEGGSRQMRIGEINDGIEVAVE